MLAAGVDFPLVHASAEDVPLQDNSFDIALPSLSFRYRDVAVGRPTNGERYAGIVDVLATNVSTRAVIDFGER
jgi:hypothetical protein